MTLAADTSETYCGRCRAWVEDPHDCRAGPRVVLDDEDSHARTSLRGVPVAPRAAGPQALQSSGAQSEEEGNLSAAIATSRPATFDEYVEAWHHYGRVIEPGMWARAGIAAAVQKDYGTEGLERLAKAAGWSRSSVFQLARVFKAFPVESRRLDCSFHLHVEALRAKEPQRALVEAAEQGLSVRELREHLRPVKPPVAAAPLADALPSRPEREAPPPAAEPRPERKASDPDPLLDPDERATRLGEAMRPAEELHIDWPEGVSCAPFIARVKALLVALDRLEQKARTA